MIRKLVLFCISIAVLCAGPPAGAQALPDAPQLAAPGAFAVGVTEEVLVHPDQPDLLATAKSSTVTRSDRTLPLTIWYPAEAPQARVHACYAVRTTDGTPVPCRQGQAWTHAAPIRGQRFPLVIFSHGYRNWATGFADLAEGLASRGYVVAAIDHRDAEPSGATTRGVSFAMTVANRSADQRFVIASLSRDIGAGLLANTYDPARIALIGYSMGGFGALTTAGAGLDPDGALVKIVPNDLLKPFVKGGSEDRAGPPPGLKAVVALAPWGGAQPLRAWTSAALAKIATPTLFIVGDHDDVSGYSGGVQWLYDSLTGANRYLLVYQNAHHNIAGDGASVASPSSFQEVERFEEPVWRRDRILAINRHFITAFLDVTLKGDQSHAAFLQPATVKADAGVWPLAPDQSVGDRYAGPDDADSHGYWPGFQRRWALGLELHHDQPAAAAAKP